MTDAKRLPQAERRARMPEVSAAVEALAAEFGEVRVDYAVEGGLVWGEPPAEGYAVNVTDMECSWRKQEKSRGTRS